MVSFPVFESLSVQDYQLYPGRKNAGLLANFGKGPWVILGVNGLGKSTLLMLLRHMLTGPVRTRSPGFAGASEDKKNDFFPSDPKIFSIRVADGAKNARAELSVLFGKKRLTIIRELKTLQLTDFYIDGQKPSSPNSSEESYRETLGKLIGIGDFANIVRILDRITFSLESRESLIWDLPAQYEILRALLLPPDVAAKIRKLEGEIVSADSSARNIHAAIKKMLERREKELFKHATSADVKADISRRTAELDAAKKREIELSEKLEKLSVRRSDTRTRQYRAEREVDSSSAEYEKHKYEILKAAFSSASPTQQYIFLKGQTENICIACGNEATKLKSTIEDRQSKNLCLICGSAHPVAPTQVHIKKLERNAHSAYQNHLKRLTALSNASALFNEVSKEHTAIEIELTKVQVDIDTLEDKIRELEGQLPSDDKKTLRREDSKIKALRNTVSDYRAERTKAENKIKGLLVELSTAVEKKSKAIERSFKGLAEPFFAEQVKLVYEPRTTKIGQGGSQFQFPAFEVDMTSGTSEGDFARRNASQVSLSQLEYLDIIFRMAIMSVLSSDGGTLVVDGPEGSVDAVFAERAGALFSSFSDIHGSKNCSVIAACNVVDGDFLPNYFRQFNSDKKRHQRTVNLLEIAAPTAALRILNRQYKGAVNRIYKQKA